MNKKLLSAVVAASLLAPAVASANTDWQFYGRAHVSVDWLDDGQESALNVNSNSSRIGFKASHELTPSLKALFQVEQEIRYDNGAGSWGSRDSFVGLEGDFGMLRLGFFDTPLKIVRGQVDMFGDQIGDGRNMTRLRDGYSGGDYDFDTRFRNGIHYRTPKFGNMHADLHYSTNTSAGITNDNDDDAISAALSYDANGLYLAGAYEVKNDTSSNAMRFGAKYTTGAFTIAGLAQFATIKDSVLVDDQDISTYGIGASYAMNDKWTLKGQYYWLSADGSDRDANMAAIGLDYRIARPFRLMFAYAATSNDDLASYSMARGGHGAQLSPAAPGENPSGFSVGFRYDF